MEHVIEPPTWPSASPVSRYRPLPRLRLVAVECTGTTAEGPSIGSPADAHVALKRYFAHKDREHLVVLHLDAAHRVVSAEVVSVGTLNSSLVHAREVFKAAILANAAAIICAHNHPSGELTPSREDRSTFESLRGAGKLLGIPVLDFLIVAGDSTWSAVDHGHWGTP